MVSSEGSDSSVQTTSTSIDLGEDLLQTTAIERPEFSDVALNTGSTEDMLHSARILIGEGLLDEAKRILRKIILADPHCVPARKRLDEIHELELKQIFGESTEPKRLADAREAQVETVDPETVLRKLDWDLELKLFADVTGQMQRAIFETPEAMEDFSTRLDAELSSGSGRDRLDMGIAFMEMGLYELALRQFRISRREADTEIAASALHAQTLILADRNFEAVLELDATLGNPELELNYQIHFIYLIATAYERLGKLESARLRYAQVLEIDPHYRDASDRIGRLPVSQK